MRIALIGPAYPYRGGIAQATDNLARELGQTHTVRVITFSRQYPALFFPGTSELAHSPEREALAGERRIDSLDPRTWLETAREVADWEPDLAIFMWWHPFFGLALGSIARRLKRLSQARIGFICHNVVPHEPMPGAVWASRFALGAGDFHLVMSATVARELTALLPEARLARTTLPACNYLQDSNGLTRQEARERLGIAPDERVALMFGLVRKYKGLDVMLRALAGVPEVRLIVAGEFYEPIRPYQALAGELGVADRVTILNRYVPDDEVPLYMLAADVLVAPYTSASQSGVLPQARAAGLPIIASDFDGLTQNFEPGETGLAVPPGDAPALSTALRQFFEPGRPAAFRRAVHGAGAAGDWPAFARALLEAAHQAEAGAGVGPTLRRFGWRRLAEPAVLLVSGGFIARSLWASAAELQNQDLAFRWWPLGLALSMEVLTNLMLVGGWLLGLRKIGVRTGFRQTARIRASSQLARFAPGNIWHLLGRLSLSERAGLPLGRVGASMVLEEGMIVLAGVAVSVLTLPFWSGLQPATGYLLLFALLPVGLALLHPRTLQLAINLGCRLFKVPTATLSLRYREVLLLFGYYTAGRFVGASATYFSLAALTPIGPAALPAIIGITTLAWSVGYLSFLTPAGLGVREAVMLVLLRAIVSAPVAGVAVLLARLFSTLGEVTFTGLVLAFARGRRPSSGERFRPSSGSPRPRFTRSRRTEKTTDVYRKMERLAALAPSRLD